MKKKDPRKSAVEILYQVLNKGVPLDKVLRDRFGTSQTRLSQDDLGLCYAIIFGVLRLKKHLDECIAEESRIGLKRIEAAVLNILRIGIYQILYLDRVPDSAAVNTSVELARRMASSRATGFVNAVLRSVCRNKTRHKAFNPESLIPPWITERWRKRYGKKRTASKCAALITPPRLTIRVNPFQEPRERVLAILKSAGIEAKPTSFASLGIRIESPVSSISSIRGFSSGLFSIQDEAAQMVTEILAPFPGDTVVDACCGMGTKTAHISQLMQNKGLIIAADRSYAKLLKAVSEFTRIGSSNITLLQWDLSRPSISDKSAMKVLVDAPCSGMGVIRRNPDIMWHVSPSDLQRLANIQIDLLKHASSMVKAGGILIYAVCSTEPEETTEVVEKFLESGNDFKPDPGHDVVPSAIQSLARGDGIYSTEDHEEIMDGFFTARFCRKK